MIDANPQLLAHLIEWVKDYDNLTARPAEDRECHVRTIVKSIMDAYSSDEERVSFILSFLDSTMRVPSLEPYSNGIFKVPFLEPYPNGFLESHLKRMAAIFARRAAIDRLVDIAGKGCVEFLIATALVNDSGSLETEYGLRALVKESIPEFRRAGEDVRYWAKWWRSNRHRTDLCALDWKAQASHLARVFWIVTSYESPIDPSVARADSLVRLALAKSPFAPAQLLALVDRDDEPAIRLALAQRDSIPLHLQDMLTVDPLVNIREFLASNQTIDDATLGTLLRDSEEGVRARAELNLSRRSSRPGRDSHPRNGDSPMQDAVQLSVAADETSPRR